MDLTIHSSDNGKLCFKTHKNALKISVFTWTLKKQILTSDLNSENLRKKLYFHLKGDVCIEFSTFKTSTIFF